MIITIILTLRRNSVIIRYYASHENSYITERTSVLYIGPLVVNLINLLPNGSFGMTASLCKLIIPLMSAMEGRFHETVSREQCGRNTKRTVTN
jgi:hypothetical protein